MRVRQAIERRDAFVAEAAHPRAARARATRSARLPGEVCRLRLDTIVTGTSSTPARSERRRRPGRGDDVNRRPAGRGDVGRAAGLPRFVCVEPAPEDLRLHVLHDQIVAPQAERRLHVQRQHLRFRRPPHHRVRRVRRDPMLARTDSRSRRRVATRALQHRVLALKHRAALPPAAAHAARSRRDRSPR